MIPNCVIKPGLALWVKDKSNNGVIFALSVGFQEELLAVKTSYICNTIIVIELTIFGASTYYY